MAGVGDELAHPGLAVVARPQRRGDAVEHPVECRAELTDLGVGTDRVHRDDRRRQAHLPGVEFEVGDIARRRRHPFQRCHLSSDDHTSDDRRRGKGDRRDRAEHHQHPQQGVVDDGGGQSDDERLRAVPGGYRDHPIGAQSIDLQAHGHLARRDRRQLFCCGRADIGGRPGRGDDTRIGASPTGDHTHRVNGLTGRVEEARAGPSFGIEPERVRVPGYLRGGRDASRSRRKAEERRRQFQDGCRTIGRLDHLTVQLVHQEALQRKLTGHADGDADHRQQRDQSDDQARAQRPGLRGEDPSHRGGRRT